MPRRDALQAQQIATVYLGWQTASIGILALVAVLLISELLLLVVWEVVSQGDMTYEVWIGERAQPDLTP